MLGAMSTAEHPRTAASTAQGQATKARILETAAGLMFQNGVARTGIKEIIDAAGVSASQIYHYFGDKQGLVRAVIEYQTETLIVPSAPEPLDSFAALERWAERSVLRQISRNFCGGCEIGSLASELLDTEPETRASLVSAFDRWEAPITAGLLAMRDRGELRPEADVEALAVSLLAGLQGGILFAQTRRDAAPLRAVLTTVLDQIRSYAT